MSAALTALLLLSVQARAGAPEPALPATPPVADPAAPPADGSSDESPVGGSTDTAAAEAPAPRRAAADPAGAVLLYGGPDASPEQERLAHRVTGADVPARWFLDHVAPAVPEVYALGGAEMTACASEPVPVARVQELATQGLALLDEILPDEAFLPYEEAATLLPYLEAPLEPERLAALQFELAIAALTRKQGTRAANKALGLEAFAAATAADPELQWNDEYSSYPRSVFFESKVALLTAPGSQVEKYEVLGPLGSGGMGSVYAVRHLVLGSRHALKILQRADPEVARRLIRERGRDAPAARDGRLGPRRRDPPSLGTGRGSGRRRRLGHTPSPSRGVDDPAWGVNSGPRGL